MEVISVPMLQVIHIRSAHRFRRGTNGLTYSAGIATVYETSERIWQGDPLHL